MTGRGRLRAAAAALAVSAVVGSGPAGASGGSVVTGDPHAIAFYRAAANATNALPSYMIVQTGYVRLAEHPGAAIPLSYAWGSAQWQRGYLPAKERLVLVQARGRTVWILDTLFPAHVACHRSCVRAYPLQLFITRGGAFAGLVLRGSTAACFQHEALSRVPYGVGTRWWFAEGRFSPLTTAGGLTTVTSRWPDAGQHAVEVDAASTTTHLFVHSTLRVAPVGRVHGFTFHQSDTRLTRVPRPPKVKVCA